MTLIEVVGVLVVIAILASLLLPALIRELDKQVADQESASLKAFCNALQESILRNRYVPGAADWITNIAKELGANISDVSTNARRQPRFYLIDPNLEVGVNGGRLPYSQGYTGSVLTNSSGYLIPPISPRIIILSSLGPALPASMVSGIPSTAGDFSNIWNTADGNLPAGVSALSGWTGAGEDLKIYRLNLAPLFVDLVLGTYSSAYNGYFAIDGSSLRVATTNSIEGYFLQNSVLRLYNGSTSNTLDSEQILVRDGSFVFESGAWKGSIVGGRMPGGLDIGGVVAQFLAAPANNRAQNGSGQQVLVVQSMMNYMSNYDLWASGNFSDNNLRNYLKNTVQPNMMSAVQGLYSGSYYPTNQPCP